MAATRSSVATSSSAGKGTLDNDNVLRWREWTPLGVRFYPTVGELILEYLIPAKDKNFPLHPGTVTRENVYRHAPMELWDIGIQHYQDTMYFVTHLSASQINVEENRETKNGIWRMIGGRQEHTLNNGTIFVKEKKYHFYQGCDRVEQFVMIEYQHDDMAMCRLMRTQVMAATGSVAAKVAPDNVDWRPLVPPGVRFYPTVEELIHYLRLAKDKNFPLPPSTVVRKNVYNHNPMDLLNIGVEHFRDAMYFISDLSPVQISKDKHRRSMDRHYWQMVGRKKQLELSGGTLVWESKYCFVWCHLDKDPAKEEAVVMTEYREEKDVMAICCLEVRNT